MLAPASTTLERRFSALAIWTFVLAFVIPIGALILGPIAMSRIERSYGSLRGKGLATAGILIGAAVLIVVVALVAAPANTKTTGNSGDNVSHSGNSGNSGNSGTHA